MKLNIWTLAALALLIGCSRSDEIPSRTEVDESRHRHVINLQLPYEPVWVSIDETIREYETAIKRLGASGSASDERLARRMEDRLTEARLLRDSPFIHRDGRINSLIFSGDMDDVQKSDFTYAQAAIDYLKGKFNVADGMKVRVTVEDSEIVVSIQGRRSPDVLGGGLIPVRVYFDRETGEVLRAITAG